jgi:hypothetical protein
MLSVNCKCKTLFGKADLYAAINTNRIKSDFSMSLRNNILAFALLTLVQSLQAQQPVNNWCGTTGKSAWLDWYYSHRDSIHAVQRGVDSTWLYVPMTIHLVGNDAGSGYFPINQAMRAVCEMNENYTDAHIRYYLMPGEPFAYHNNSKWYEHDWSGGSEMINANRLPNRINNFVVGDPAGNCGYSWQDAVVMGRNCSGGGNSTWSHEFGHHLSLPHPFYGWEGFTWDYSKPAPEAISGYPVEKVDGSNCYNSGDRFCDTRPDYLNYRWSCNGNFESTLVLHDPNDSTFRSDATLYMGYSLDACASRFTPEQIEAMRTNLYTEHQEYLQITEPLASIPANETSELLSPIDTQIVQYNNINVNFKAPTNGTIYQLEIGLFPNFVPTIYTKSIYSPDEDIVSIHLDKSMPNNRLLYWHILAYNEWDMCASPTPLQVGVFKTQNLSGTTWLERNLQFELMPNPVAAGTRANLLISASSSLDGRIVVMDLAGRTCLSISVEMSSGDQQLEIPTENLFAGAYILMLQSEKGTLTKKLVIGQ